MAMPVEVRPIRKRNRRMSSEITDSAASSGQLQLVTFKLGAEEFGLDVMNVREIDKTVTFTQIPNSPDFIEGIINLRNNVIPVIDLRRKFNMEFKLNDQHTRIIVAELEGKTVGLRVDAVQEVLRISSDGLEPPPSTVFGTDAIFIKGIARVGVKILMLVNLAPLISSGERIFTEELCN